MEELKMEQTEQTPRAADAEQTIGGSESEVSYGKFKAVNALINAYNSLQSEFTKRCQKVKELESRLEAVGKTNAPINADITAQKEDINKESKEKILKEYLLDVLGKKPKAIVLDGSGVGVKTPINKPKTIQEAGKLAKDLFKK